MPPTFSMGSYTSTEYLGSKSKNLRMLPLVLIQMKVQDGPNFLGEKLQIPRTNLR